MRNLDAPTTAVHLTPEEARLFVEFQKRYAFVQLMDSVGAFSVRSGSVTVHFDDRGGIGSVDVHRRYRAGSYPQEAPKAS